MGLSKINAALLIGVCLLATLFAFDQFMTNSDDDQYHSTELARRNLKVRKKKTRKRKLNNEDGVYRNLKSVTETPVPAKEVVLFWTMPKSGDTYVREFYGCLDLTIAHRAGALPQFGHDKDTKIIAYRPWGDTGPSYVNADTTSYAGILRSERLRLVPSGLVDIIFTSFPNYATPHLYDQNHRGRALGMFRHPVERLASKFYYLQVADWERTYNPGWAKLKIGEWARNINKDNNSHVKRLAGILGQEEVTEEHLQLAMNTLREKFVVGLTEEMEESIRRFNIVLGVDLSKDRSVRCMDEYFGDKAVKVNSNPHRKVKEGDPAWKALAETNSLDMKLWDYTLQLFDEQKELIDHYEYSFDVKLGNKLQDNGWRR